MKEIEVPVNPEADVDEARYHVPFDMPAQDAIKNIARQAICHVNGVLGLKGTLGDVFKRDDDITRGITVHNGDLGTEIKGHIILDAAQSPNQVVDEVQKAVVRALYEGAGMQAVDVAIKVADTMDRKAFYAKYGPDRTCDAAIQ